MPLGKDELYEHGVHFDIPEADFDSKTRLGLITTLISRSEQLVSVLKEEERELFLLDCLRIVSKMGDANGEEQKQIKELEANIASLKEQQVRELEAAKERLKAARSETGASPGGSNIANLKSILRHDIRIAGALKAIVHDSTFVGNMYADIVPLGNNCRKRQQMLATFVARGSKRWQHLSLSSVYTCIPSRSTFFTTSSGLWMR